MRCETLDNLPDTVRVGGDLPDVGEHDAVGRQLLALLPGPGPGLAPGHLLQQEKREILLST